jgi:hypothetical protein
VEQQICESIETLSIQEDDYEDPVERENLSAEIDDEMIELFKNLGA